jgi:hypothetical protein
MSKIIENLEDFELKLKSFQRSTRANMLQALQLSQFTIQHFERHGDLGPVQRFYNAMTKNYHRRAAYKVWVMAHSPVKVEGDKFTKDKGEDARPFDVQGALKKPFWEFAPEKEDVYFVTEDVYTAVMKTIKKFQGEKYHAADKTSGDFIANAMAAIEELNTRFVPSEDAPILQ